MELSSWFEKWKKGLIFPSFLDFFKSYAKIIKNFLGGYFNPFSYNIKTVVGGG